MLMQNKGQGVQSGQAPNRGQGAIEYLLIIGAAILVIAIVIIAISGALGTGTNQSAGAKGNQMGAFVNLRQMNLTPQFFRLPSVSLGPGQQIIFNYTDPATGQTTQTPITNQAQLNQALMNGDLNLYLTPPGVSATPGMSTSYILSTPQTNKPKNLLKIIGCMKNSPYSQTPSGTAGFLIGDEAGSRIQDQAIMADLNNRPVKLISITGYGGSNYSNAVDKTYKLRLSQPFYYYSMPGYFVYLATFEGLTDNSGNPINQTAINSICNSSTGYSVGNANVRSEFNGWSFYNYDYDIIYGNNPGLAEIAIAYNGTNTTIIGRDNKGNLLTDTVTAYLPCTETQWLPIAGYTGNQQIYKRCCDYANCCSRTSLGILTSTNCTIDTVTHCQSFTCEPTTCTLGTRKVTSYYDTNIFTCLNQPTQIANMYVEAIISAP